MAARRGERGGGGYRRVASGMEGNENRKLGGHTSGIEH